MNLDSLCPRVRVAGIITENSRLLLIAHKKDGEIYWLLPGGGVDFGESLEEALTRELREELNISVKINKISFLSDSINPLGQRHVVNICFKCSYVSGDYRLGIEDRLHGFNFFTAKEIESLKIYPPINEELVSVLKGEDSPEYLGKMWEDE